MTEVAIKCRHCAKNPVHHRCNSWNVKFMTMPTSILTCIACVPAIALYAVVFWLRVWCAWLLCVSSGEGVTAVEVVPDHRNPLWPENGHIVRRVDRVSDLRAVCVQNNTGSFLPVTKTIPHITRSVAPLWVFQRADRTAELPTLTKNIFHLDLINLLTPFQMLIKLFF